MNLLPPMWVDRQRWSVSRAFTMIEVALSLAIVAFALVAIIGVMPAGLNVQKENREDTSISRDGAFLLEAIRSGSNSANFLTLPENLEYLVVVNGGITNGFTAGMLNATQIVSQLSRPKQDPSGGTNFVQAQFRAFSGILGERSTNARAMAFSYVVTSEVSNYRGDTNNVVHNYFLTNNLYEVKLTFRWPILDSASSTGPFVGNGRYVFRTLISGQLANQPISGLSGSLTDGYFFKPSTLIGL